MSPLHHVRRGSGEPLVLVHGLGSEWRAWMPLLDRLAAERDVIALDLPGFGESAPLPDGEVPTVERLADAVESFFGELGIERPHVAGHSTGGGAALELAKRGAVRSALALSPVGFWNEREYAWSRFFLRLDRATAERIGPIGEAIVTNRAIRTLLYGHMLAKPWRVPRDELVRSLRAYGAAPGFDATLDALRDYRFVPNGRPPVPVTIAWGSLDSLVLARQAKRARRLLPDARLVMLPGCGHAAMWDDPGAVAEAILTAG
jgi:pimeloyl-ACP methyl ester carboxylesterase